MVIQNLRKWASTQTQHNAILNAAMGLELVQMDRVRDRTGVVSGSSTQYVCACVVKAPNCQYTDGKVVNEDDCWCSVSSLCNSNTDIFVMLPTLDSALQLLSVIIETVQL